MRLGFLGELALLTIRDAESAMRVLRGLDLPMQARWMVLLLAVALSRMLGVILTVLVPVEGESPLLAILTDPMMMAGLEFVGMVLTAFLIAWLGRLFGGHGTFADALLAVAWIELILVVFMAAQLVLVTFAPLAADLLGLFAGLLSIYLTVTVTKALHGFRSVVMVALAYFGFSLLLGIAVLMMAPDLFPMPEVTS